MGSSETKRVSTKAVSVGIVASTVSELLLDRSAPISIACTYRVKHEQVQNSWIKGLVTAANCRPTNSKGRMDDVSGVSVLHYRLRGCSRGGECCRDHCVVRQLVKCVKQPTHLGAPIHRSNFDCG